MKRLKKTCDILMWKETSNKIEDKFSEYGTERRLLSLVLGLDIGASAIKAVLMEDVLQGEVIRKFYHYPYGNQTREEALEYFFESVVLEDYDRLVVSLKGYEGSVRIVELPFNEIRKVRSVLPQLENEFADGSHERSFRFHSIPNRAENIRKSSIFKYWCVRFSRQ